MPELPEVATVITELKSCVLNKPVKQVKVHLDKVLKNTNVKQLNDALVNHSFVDIKRRGKYIIFCLSNGLFLVSHLRMEGKYFFEAKGSQFDLNHVLVEFLFQDCDQLNYHDTRQFGTFHLFNRYQFENARELNKLALDPLDQEFNHQAIFNKGHKSNKKIKTFILDQTNISGIGNIYADEILFASKIHPETLAKNLNLSQYQLICQNATDILKKAVEMKGTTIGTFTFKKDHTGGYQHFLKIHGKKGKQCQSCNTTIIKKKINGRGSYICEKCQIQR